MIGACLALAGCGGSYSSSSSQTNKAAAGSPQQTISISEKEFSLTPSTVTVDKSGTVAFKVTNDGQLTHGFEVEGNGVEQEIGSIAPGESATLKVALSKDGSYEMYCPIDGHRGKGMEGSVHVGSSAGSGMDTGGTTTTEQTTTTKGGGYGY